MKINQIELRHLKLPLVSYFETSFGRVYHQETLIVKITAERLMGRAPLEAKSNVPLTGWGECPASAAP